MTVQHKLHGPRGDYRIRVLDGPDAMKRTLSVNLPELLPFQCVKYGSQIRTVTVGEKARTEVDLSEADARSLLQDVEDAIRSTTENSANISLELTRMGAQPISVPPRDHPLWEEKVRLEKSYKDLATARREIKRSLPRKRSLSN